MKYLIILIPFLFTSCEGFDSEGAFRAVNAGLNAGTTAYYGRPVVTETVVAPATVVTPAPVVAY